MLSCGFLFCLAIITWIAVFSSRPKDFIEVSFLDIGQGDAILIEGRTGNQILIDAGPGKNVLRKLAHALPLFDRSLDVLIETHPDKDHIGGFPFILDRYHAGLFLSPGVSSDNTFDDEIEYVLEKKGIRHLEARSGTVFDLEDGSYLEILFPDRDVGGFETNTASVIARLVYGNTCFLFTGDAPQEIENYLIGIYGDSLACDVLKVGHHGSRTSTGPFLLSAVSPTYAVVSAGKDNSYGHPHAEVVKRLTSAGANVLSTAEEGTITFRSDGINIIHK